MNELCTVESGLFKKKPCGQASVAKWADSDSVPECFSEEILSHKIRCLGG